MIETVKPFGYGDLAELKTIKQRYDYLFETKWKLAEVIEQRKEERSFCLSGITELIELKVEMLRLDDLRTKMVIGNLSGVNYIYKGVVIKET